VRLTLLLRIREARVVISDPIYDILILFVLFHLPSRQVKRWYLILGYDAFLSHPFKFIIP
jgi:hypothetical protein